MSYQTQHERLQVRTEGDDDEEDLSFSDSEASQEGHHIPWHRRYCCGCPRMYPYWLCPPFWLLHPRKAYRLRSAVIVNIILIGLVVYEFILCDMEDICVDALTTYLRYIIIPVAFFVAYKLNKLVRLRKVVMLLAIRVQRQIDLANETVESINQLGEARSRYHKEVNGLSGVIKKTKRVRRLLNHRIEQSDRENEHINRMFKVVKVQRERLKTSKVALSSSREDHRSQLDEIESSVDALHRNTHGINETAEFMAATLTELEEMIDAVKGAVDNMGNQYNVDEIEESDASRDDLAVFVHNVTVKRDKLRNMTTRLELGVARQLAISTLHDAGESGIDRTSWNDLIARLPASAQRAAEEMGDRAQFDGIRQEGRTKVFDSKIGRKKRPGISEHAMLSFLVELEEKMNALKEQPLGTLMAPKANNRD